MAGAMDYLLRRENEERRKKGLQKNVRTVLFDFDGVFTDNKVYLDQNGVESVRCDRGDGLGLAMLRDSGIRIAVVSKEQNPVVAARCEKLGIEVWHGIDDKPHFVSEWLQKNSLSWESTAYVGNDVNDIGCLVRAGLGICPSDAVREVLEIADIILESRGGEGAVRELCDVLKTSGQIKK